MSTPKPTRDEFIEAAMQANWTWIDEHLQGESLADEDLQWAVHRAEIHHNQQVHLLGAKMLAVSDLPLEPSDLLHMENWMVVEKSQTAKYLLAIALRKRQAGRQTVGDLFERALEDPVAGPTALRYKAA